MPEPTTWTAVAAMCSAAAASFSAFSAFLVMRIHRRNYLESVSPQIVLEGWSREAEPHSYPGTEVVKFTSVKNIGRGVALHLIVNTANVAEGDFPLATMSTLRLPALGTNDIASVDDGSIVLWWANAKQTTAGSKFIPIEITIYCWDTGDRRHETQYHLMVYELSQPHVMTNAIAPGVMSARRTIVEPVWRLKRAAKARERRVRFWKHATGITGHVRRLPRRMGVRISDKWKRLRASGEVK
jgi:hypothetical protein